MVVSCSNCNSRYRVDEEKVENKKFAFICPNCKFEVIIDNKQKKEALLPPSPSTVKEDQPEGISNEESKIMNEGIEGEGVPQLEEGEDINLTSGEAGLDLGEIEGEGVPQLEEGEDINLTAEEAGLDLTEADHVKISQTDGVEDLSLPVEEESLKPASKEVSIGKDKNAVTKMKVDPDVGDDLPLDDMIDPGYKDDFQQLNDTKGSANEGSELSVNDFHPVEEEIDLSGIDLEESLSVEDTVKASSESEGKSLAKDTQFVEDIRTDEVFSKENGDTDESITIDLDSLDLQFEEGEDIGDVSETVEEIHSGETDLEIEDQGEVEKIESDDDMDITLDLDSLDIALDEAEEMQEGERMEDDEKLTLDDVGLSLSDVSSREDFQQKQGKEPTENDIRDDYEVATEISNNIFDGEKKVNDHGEVILKDLSETDNPLISCDDISFKERVIEDVLDEPTNSFDHDIEKIQDFERSEVKIERIDEDLSDTIPFGVINFSIDYSLKFSPLGALLRLSGLYLIFLLPHLIVFLIYFILAFFLSMLNWIVIILTGDSVDDFILIQENTLRYMFSLGANAMDVVEDLPFFAGRKDIDYPLQFEITYPVRYSRGLSILRFSLVGIVIIALPHLILLTLLSIGSILICLAGLVSVVAIKRWPNILFDFMIRYFRYASSVFCFVFGLVDKYPTLKVL